MFESFIAKTWNSLSKPRPAGTAGPGLDCGCEVVDQEITSRHVRIPASNRPEHLVVLGKTGQGKSSLLCNWVDQDIRRRLGFAYFDVHGDATQRILRRVAFAERESQRDLSDRLIVIEPGDPEFSIGLNVLEAEPGQENYVQLSEFAQILKARWNLDSFGARTEELLRNALHVLSDNHLTLLELAPLLTDGQFRTSCLVRVGNSDVQEYFRSRFDTRSEAMQSVFRDAILNKVSGFTADRRFRHILGQQHSSFSLLEAMDRGWWIILNLDKGRLGEQAPTLGSLLLTKLKNALFRRTRRQLFTLYCDEIQNLVAYDTGLETLFSEARKFGISVVSANQYLDQYPPAMRAAVMAVGTHVSFQLSSVDAERVASAFDAGKRLGERLKNLPKRHLVIKTGSDRPKEVRVGTVEDPEIDTRDLYARCRRRWAKKRTEVEVEIRARGAVTARSRQEDLHDWD